MGRLFNIFIRVFRAVFGILLLPVCVVSSIAFYEQLKGLASLSDGLVFYFFLGIITYNIIHIAFFKLTRLYVFNHELIHAISTWMSGGAVKSFKASSKEGNITATKTSAFISLSPYFVPLYTILFALAYFGASYIWDISQWSNLFIFFIGASVAFHIIMTTEHIKAGQEDILQTGYIISITVIYIVNLLVLSLLMNLLFGKFSFIAFIQSSFEKSSDFYRLLFSQLFL